MNLQRIRKFKNFVESTINRLGHALDKFVLFGKKSIKLIK